MKKLLFALGIALLLLGSLQHLNAALMSATIGAGRSLLWACALAGALALGASLLWFASARADAESTPGFVTATLVGVVALGYAGFLAFVPVPAWVVDHDPLPDADFIPDDGHPTPEGNRHFAALIGAAIDRAGVIP